MDKREFPRYDKDLHIEYAAPEVHKTKPDPGRILNISLGGVYMITESALEKDSTITLMFTVNKNGNATTLSTTGSVLRSGKIDDDPEMMKKYGITTPNGSCFAVLKFTAPFLELSFMLQ